MDWYVAQLKPNGLVRARRNLERLGHGVWMPVLETEKRTARGPVKTRVPVFPGYLFVQFDAAVPGWGAINNTFGVARLICAGRETPLALPGGFVQELRKRCDAEDCILPPRELQPGEAVTLISGPFAGLVAQVIDMKPDGRVGLLLEMLGGHVRSTVDLRAVARADLR